MNMLIPSGSVSMTSREIAELVGSRHDSVRRTVERLAERGTIALPPLVEKSTAGRPATHYVFTGEKGKRDSYVVVAQLSPEFTAKLVDRWQELETGQTAKHPAELSRLEILQLAMESEQGRLQAVTERDEAIRTKAEIGSRREATAMATASAATRKVRQLENELGWGTEYGTVTAVEKAADVKFPRNVYVALRKWCEFHGVAAQDVPDKRYGKVKAWPAGAWMELHGIDLDELFRPKAA